MNMSSLVIHGCAIALLATCACAPRASAVSKHPNAEARNSENTEKKPRKRRPTLVAPPPAYGNKIVLERDHRQSGSEPERVRL